MVHNIRLTSPFLQQECEILREFMTKYGTKITYPKKTTIVRPGDTVDCLYYVDTGRIRYSSINPDGIEKTLMILEKGAYFGEGPIFTNTQSDIYAITETPVVLYIIKQEKVLELINTSTNFRDSIYKCLTNKIGVLMRHIEGLIFNTVKERLQHLFCSSINKECSLNSNDGWYQLKVQYTQHEMANIVGASRVTVAKLISELCEEGLLRIVNRKIEVRCGICPNKSKCY